MRARIADVSRGVRAEALVGRDFELASLEGLVDAGTRTLVAYVHGPAGIGKTAVLTAFEERCLRRSLSVRYVDCRTVEPTERGLLGHLASTLHSASPGLADIVEASEQLAQPIVLILDNFEAFRLLDPWLRTSLIPSLPDTFRVVVAGRQPPLSGWLISSELEGIVEVLRLGPLPEPDAIRLFSQLGMDETRARHVNRVARGHPLAIRLAALGARDHSYGAFEEEAIDRVVEELTRIYLMEIDDPEIRRAVEASSVVRRVTASLLRAMLQDASGEAAMHRLELLPFTESGSDGLVIHDAVHEALQRYLKATDPRRYGEYRRRAWRQLRTEVAEAPPSELWRYTADVLYLIENPVLREAFFPSGAQPLSVEPASRDDRPLIRQLVRRHEPEEAASVLDGWLEHHPETFSVVRDRDAQVAGFSCVLSGEHIASPSLRGDQVVEAWGRHLREHPVPKGQLVLGLRRWLDRDHGERPGPVQAACWLDVKRTYMSLRPRLRRMYVVVEDAATYWPVVEKLGFQQFPTDGGADAAPTGTIILGSRPYTSVVLDFGPGSVDGWLARLAAAELGIDRTSPLDEVSHELVVDGNRVGLTPLEFGLFGHLDAAGGRAVPRAELLRDVWGHAFEGGSNVVDVVVRSLRGKLGAHRDLIDTVRGVGYRLQQDWRDIIS
jgi:hypothetical protein